MLIFQCYLILTNATGQDLWLRKLWKTQADEDVDSLSRDVPSDIDDDCCIRNDRIRVAHVS